jgi:hypothetical protein
MPQRRQRARRGQSPRNSSSQVSEQTPVQSNSEAVEAMENPVSGILGRLFNRILGQKEESTETAEMGFNKDQLQTYISDQIDFAEGEWFRGKKVSGVAEKLMEELDRNKDGLVDWNEFQRSVLRLRSVLGIEDDTATMEDVAESSGTAFEKVSPESTSIGLSGLQNQIAQSLPKETKHLDLIAQFAARLAIDLADSDQRDLPLADRSIDRNEWVNAAQDLAGGS